MSPDEDALLNGIAADPAADLPRLVYADWLEEHGQELRAEFIRIQCEIAKLEVGPRDVIDRNVHLWQRQQELLDGHMAALLKDIPLEVFAEQVMGSRFYRGFLDEVSVPYGRLADFAPLIVKTRPMPTFVSLSTDERYSELEQVVTQTYAAIVTDLSLFRPNSTVSGSYVDDSDITFEELRWPRLCSFTSVNSAMSISGMIILLRDNSPTLARLNVHSSSFNDNDVIDLLNAGILQRLSHISMIENDIGDQAALDLADRLGNSPKLKELDLRRNGITTVGQAALLERLGSKVILF